MPNRRRIGYMPTRRFDDKQNVERQKSKRRRLVRNEPGVPDGGHANLEEWTMAELYALAQKRNLRGRSTMTKERLIHNLRKAE